MIQELLFGGSSTTPSSAYSGGEERKALINNNNNGGIIAEATTAAASKNSSSDKASNNGNSNPEKNLRCPRCDSSNTKFCYYNNYNLTQPRHFCKTCRRYWTKGGALRNIPIGGGCRKNKTSFTGKPKVYTSSADVLLKSGLLDPQESSLHHPLMWSSPPQPQTSHLLAFLRSTQSPNPNPSNHTHLISSSPLQNSNQAMNLLSGQTPFSGYDYPCSTFLRNKNQTLALSQPQHPQVPQQQNQVAQQLSGVQKNSGIQELYRRMNLSTNSNTISYNSSGGNDTNHAYVVLGNGHGVSVSSSPTSSRLGLESPPATVGGGSDLGQWNIPVGDYSTWTNDHLCPL